MMNSKKEEDSYLEETVAEFGEIGYLSSSIVSLRQQQQHNHQQQQETLLEEKEKDVVRIVEPQKIKLHKRINERLAPFKAYLLAISSAFLFCLNNVILRMLDTLTPTDNGVINYTVWGIVLLAIAKYNNINVLGEKKIRLLLNLRGAIGAIGLLSIYTGLRFIDPSDVISITHASLIITAVLARIFLKERLTIAHLVAAILTMCGILFICKPKFLFSTNTSKHNTSYSIVRANTSNLTITENIVLNESFNTIIGVSVTLLGATGLGIVQIFLKQLTMKKCHYSLMTLFAVYYGIPFSLIISVTLVLTGRAHTNIKSEMDRLPMHILYSMGVGLLGVAGQILINLSFKYESATKIAIIRTTDVFFSFILQYILLNIKTDILNFFGAMCIFVAVVFIFIFKIIQDRVDNHESSDVENVNKKSRNIFYRFLFFSI